MKIFLIAIIIIQSYALYNKSHTPQSSEFKTEYIYVNKKDVVQVNTDAQVKEYIKVAYEMGREDIILEALE